MTPAAILAKALASVDHSEIGRLATRLGIPRAQIVRAANGASGQPTRAEYHLKLCAWLGVDPVTGTPTTPERRVEFSHVQFALWAEGGVKQSRATSLIKSIVSTAVGFAVAFVANMIILPWFGLEISHGANFILTCIYTVISIARGYALERLFEAMGWRTRMSAFALAVLAERQRQINVEGWTPESDDVRHQTGDLAQAGACYALSRYAVGVRDEPGKMHYPASDIWPWDAEWWKPTGFRRDLVKGAALILAEGERFDRNRKRKPAVIPRSTTPSTEVA